MGSYSLTMLLFIPSFFLALLSQYGSAQDFEARSLGKISSPDVSCGYWTRNTVLVGPTTVATVTSQLVNIKRCSVLFKLAGRCTGLKMACSNFNVPKGPDRRSSFRPSLVETKVLTTKSNRTRP
eukprot:TRINITY_DN11095_c0_g1_i2.p1 TRINITY_DN11095_c0_g1~~TRINITY_DN11095_c0_g1_i2.p1  ORF type:complete len:143 (-),score=7.99 TRINITY_DN11095_c0_g1_i2:197-568(-)